VCVCATWIGGLAAEVIGVIWEVANWAVGLLLRLQQVWLQRCAEQAQVCSFWLDWKLYKGCNPTGLFTTRWATWRVFQMKGGGGKCC
jgi:hypothetical protein